MLSHASYVFFLASAPSFAVFADVFGVSNFPYRAAPAEGGGGLLAPGRFGGGAHCAPAFAQGFPRTPDAP